MPVDLTPHCKGILHDIVTTSERIRHSASHHANAQNFQVSERLRSQLDKIRTSADTIFAAVTEASFTDYIIDDGLVHWLFSGAHSCLAKLKEMDTMLKPIGPAQGNTRSLTSGEDKLAATVVYFNRHKDLFHFLITPDVWSRERLLHQPSRLEGALHANDLMIPEGAEYRPQESHSSNVGVTESDMGHTLKIRHLKDSHRQQLDEILRWLAVLNCTDKHNYIRQLRQEGTCKWFPNTDTYRLWRTRGAFFSTSKYTPTVRKPRPQNAQFLWLHGKAGCGKSVLVASTIEHLKTTLQYQEVVVFFYFDFQNDQSRSPVEMMRSLLSQLCRHLLDLGVDAGNFPTTMLEEKGKGTLSLGDLDRLCDLVSSAADRFVWEPIVVIDALDECADIRSLLRALVRLHDDDKVRLLVTSRPHQEVLRHFTKFPSLSFEDVTVELAADIELHVRQEINRSQLKVPGPEMKKEIHEKLIKKAEGRFRWVQCQIDILKRCTTAQELKKALDNLPTELEATYERILDAIDERSLEGKLARRVLAWLTVALEPLRLIQILDMLLVDFPSQRNIIREGVELIDMLSSLVSHYKKTDVVSLSHFSVKEFLTGRTTLPMYQIILSDAHSEAVLSCMRYISAFIKQVPFPRNITLESWPMLPYVFSSGFNHLVYIDHESIVALDALQSLGLDARRHPSHWDRLCQLRENLQLLYPPWPSPRHDLVLYILIAYAPVELFQALLSGRWLIKARIGTNPLVYAADLRKTNHAVALLACGSDINAQGLAIDDSHRVSPLEISIDRDEEVLVGELLQRGCLVPSQLLATTICMPWCSARVLVKLTQTDEFTEWAHTIGDEKLYRGIFSSARPNAGDIKKADEDHVALARRLRQIGQDLSADNPFGAELTERALHAAHISMLEYLLPADQPPPARFLFTASTGDTSETVSIVRFLLERGADINVVSEEGDTALHLAARCHWEPRSLDLIKMLIDGGCDPCVTNLRGETPLTIAACSEYVSVVEHLLFSNISLPSDTLPNALRRHFAPKIVQLLVHNSAGVNTVLNGETVLHLAITEYEEPLCLELVGIFVEAGCNASISSSQRERTLYTAIERKYTSVVEFLLSHNVLLPHCILPFTLQQSSPLSLVQLLIHNGADVHSSTPEGEIVLHLAISNYDQSECWQLVGSFVEAGCSTTTCNPQGEVALHAAIRHRYTSVVELLLSYDDPLPSGFLPFALQQCLPLSLVQLLIHSGAEVQSTTPEGETIFHLAISKYSESECQELVKIFVEAGGESNVRDAKGETALDTAIRRGYTPVAERLLSYNVLLPRRTLPFSLQQCSLSHLVRLVIYNNADSTEPEPEPRTLLHLAISQYKESTCSDLLKSFTEAGGKINIRDSNGKPILYAINHEYIVVELLLPHDVQLPRDSLPFRLQLRLACSLVQLLVHNGADVHSTTSERETTFHLAISKHHIFNCWGVAKIFLYRSQRRNRHLRPWNPAEFTSARWVNNRELPDHFRQFGSV